MSVLGTCTINSILSGTIRGTSCTDTVSFKNNYMWEGAVCIRQLDCAVPIIEEAKKTRGDNSCPHTHNKHALTFKPPFPFLQFPLSPFHFFHVN